MIASCLVDAVVLGRVPSKETTVVLVCELILVTSYVSIEKLEQMYNNLTNNNIYKLVFIEEFIKTVLLLVTL